MTDFTALQEELAQLKIREEQIKEALNSRFTHLIDEIIEYVGQDEDAFRAVAAELSDLGIQNFDLMVTVRRPRRANKPNGEPELPDDVEA